MTTIQRIIKYFATIFAILIIIGITSAILLSANIFSEIFGITKESRRDGSYPKETIGTNQNDNREERNVQTSQKYKKEFENSEITNLKIDVSYASLMIQQGEKFVIETNTKDVETKQIANQIIIQEKNINLFRSSNPRRIIVTLPKDAILETIKIEAGAGEFQIEKLSCKNLDLEIGAGKMAIQELKVMQKAKIEGGAGKVEILSGEINNLNLNMGVGSFKLVTALTGSNKIEAGVGKLEVSLKDGIENYTIRTSKGIGSIKINGQEVKNNSVHGEGKTNIKLEGGIGSIIVQ